MVANVITMVLKNDQTVSEKSILLSCQEVSTVNHITRARMFNEGMQTLWPNDVKSDVLYPSAHKLVANGKKIFVISPARTELSRNKAPDTPLPPTPVSKR
jgi:hypothetical protein